MGKFMIITNNPLVCENNSDELIHFIEEDLLALMKFVRNKVHLGHRLLSHPLAGSIKPNETPFKYPKKKKNPWTMGL